jgi:Zn-dependent hydrolases, including glyoxylases
MNAPAAPAAVRHPPSARDADTIAGLPLREVLPGILMFTLPVEYGIDHVNVYLIQDGKGWCLFDTGSDCASARKLWEQALAGPLQAGLTRIVVSHHHPDHMGLAVWLHERTGAPIWMRPEEAHVAEQMHVRRAEEQAECVRFICRHGLSEPDASAVVHEVLQASMACAVPDHIETIAPNAQIAIGAHVFEALVLGGHSVAQVCLYEPNLKLLLTGDQLLERIRPTSASGLMAKPIRCRATSTACAPSPGSTLPMCCPRTTACTRPACSVPTRSWRTTSAPCANSWPSSARKA